MEFYRGSTIPEENLKKATEIQPDFPAVVRRIAELAATAPKDPAVRDAMLWVIRADPAAAARTAASSPWRQLARPALRRRPRRGAGGSRARQLAELRARQPALVLLRLGQEPRIEGTGPAGAGAVSRAQGDVGRGGQEGGRPADVHARRSRPRRRNALYREGGHARRRLRLPPAPEAVRRGVPPRRGRAAVRGGDRRVRRRAVHQAARPAAGGPAQAARAEMERRATHRRSQA